MQLTQVNIFTKLVTYLLVAPADVPLPLPIGTGVHNHPLFVRRCVRVRVRITVPMMYMNIPMWGPHAETPVSGDHTNQNTT